jgi:predicted ATPase
MLTRIEIDGFKTFENFTLDLEPLIVILGPNAVGKSNFMDAVQLLSLLAETDLRSAIKGIRGEPHELFRRQADGSFVNRMTFAVEVLLSPQVTDPWGAEVEMKSTRLRYEVAIARRQDDRGRERLVIESEVVLPILKHSDTWMPGGQRPSKAFQSLFLRHGNRRTPFLTTEKQVGKAQFVISQDGTQGRNLHRPAENAEATVVSSITTTEFPHLYALREEMRNWRFLQLDAHALRRPSSSHAPDDLEEDGGNLPTVLARLQDETSDESHPAGIIAEIAASLAELVPEVAEIGVHPDNPLAPREYQISVRSRDGAEFTAAVLSDGTLRLLALLALLYDPRHQGVLCFEEPENGIHPERLVRLLQLMRELVVDPLSETIDPDTPLAQIIMNSHSPVVLNTLRSRHGEVLFADALISATPNSEGMGWRSRFRKVSPTKALLTTDEAREFVTVGEVDDYLAKAGGKA